MAAVDTLCNLVPVDDEVLCTVVNENGRGYCELLRSRVIGSVAAHSTVPLRVRFVMNVPRQELVKSLWCKH